MAANIVQNIHHVISTIIVGINAHYIVDPAFERVIAAANVKYTDRIQSINFFHQRPSIVVLVNGSGLPNFCKETM